MGKTHILVDFLPKKSCDCPFSYYEEEFDYGYVCRLDKNEDTCLLEQNKPCDKLRNAYTCSDYKGEAGQRRYKQKQRFYPKLKEDYERSLALGKM